MCGVTKLGWIGVPENIEDFQGFVYRITNLKNSKFYIGQKSFWRIDKRAPLKNILSKAVITKIEKLEKKYEQGLIKTKKELKLLISEVKSKEKERRASLKNTNKRHFKVETEWKTYFGSSEWLKHDVVEFGEENFKREIIWLCTGKWWLSYLELKEQLESNAIFRQDFYNGIINIRLASVVKEEDFKNQIKVFSPKYNSNKLQK